MKKKIKQDYSTETFLLLANLIEELHNKGIIDGDKVHDGYETMLKEHYNDKWNTSKK